MNPDPAHFDLNDIEHEPSDEQLAALMEAVAEEARRRGDLARRASMDRLQATLDAAFPPAVANERA
jgi:hypothetical protein